MSNISKSAFRSGAVLAAVALFVFAGSLQAQTDTTKADTMKTEPMKTDTAMAAPAGAAPTGAAPAGAVQTQTPPPAQQAPPQEAPAQQAPPQEEPESDFQTQRYIGGTLGASFGDYTSVRIQPMIGWIFSPKFSGGLKLGYEYVSDNRYDPSLTSHNYGASTFGRFHLLPSVYAHGEFAYINYEYYTSRTTTEREWIPFLLAGAGYIHHISPAAGIYVEVLFDVLQDDRSPYEEWEPFVSIGVQVGM